MSEQAVTAKGLKFRFSKWHLRIWWKGFEYGNHLGGRVVFFPWGKPKAPLTHDRFMG